MKSLTIALAFLSLTAGAVTTKNCPQTLKVTYEALDVYSAKRMEKEAQKISNFDLDEEAYAARDILESINSFEFQELEYKLFSTEKSMCRYLQEGQKELKYQGDNETRLFTQDGRIVLRIALAVDKKNYYWTYHTVLRMEPKRIEVRSDASPVYGSFDHGAPRFRMGWADDVDISAE